MGGRARRLTVPLHSFGGDWIGGVSCPLNTSRAAVALTLVGLWGAPAISYNIPPIPRAPATLTLP